MQTILDEVEQDELELESGVTVCGGNITTPVIDQTPYMGNEIFYCIGGRQYITNAD